MSDDTRQFAHGANSVQGWGCPARQSNHTAALVAVWEYDSQVTLATGKERGVVGEEIAKQAWLSMIDTLEGVDPEALSQDRNPLKDARRVARDLNWGEDSDE
jgi:hypothetical protein